MEILSTERFLLRLIGALHRADWKISLIYYGCLTSPILLLLPSFAFFCGNISDVGRATDSVYIIFILTLTTLKHLTFVRRGPAVESLVEDLQRIVAFGEWKLFAGLFAFHLLHFCAGHWAKAMSDAQPMYQATDALSRAVVKFSIWSSMAAITASMLIPVLVVIFHWLDGSYSPEVWLLPTGML